MLCRLAAVLLAACAAPGSAASDGGAFGTAVYEADSGVCYDRFGNCDIINYKAYRRVWRIADEQSCARVCTSDEHRAKCIAAVYDRAQYICNLYDQDGTVLPAFLVPAFMKVLIMPRPAADNDELACMEGGGGGTAPPTAGTTSSTTPRTTTTTTAATVTTTRRTTTTTRRPTTTTTRRTTTTRTTQPPVEGGACGASERPLMLRLAETELSSAGDDGVIFDDIGEDDCLALCELDQAPGGKTRPCRAAAFVLEPEVELSACILYDDRLPNEGEVQLSEPLLPTETAFVKLCYPESWLTDGFAVCPGDDWPASRTKSLTVEPFKQYTFDFGAANIADCIEACVQDFCASLGFDAETGVCDLFDANSQLLDTAYEEHGRPNYLYAENACLLQSAQLRQTALQRRAAEKLQQAVLKPVDSAPGPAAISTLDTAAELDAFVAENRHALGAFDALVPQRADGIAIGAVGGIGGGSAERAPLNRRPKRRQEVAQSLLRPPRLYGYWTAWTPCQAVPGGGGRVSVRVRTCADHKWNCDGERVQIRPCLAGE